MSDVSSLIQTWQRRDELYARRKTTIPGPALAENEVFAVRSWRIKEAEMLDGSDRRLAVMALGRWSPPTTRTR